MTLHAVMIKSTEAPPPRDPLRQSLADAIEYHTALSAALEENLAAQKRAQDIFWVAVSALTAATEAVEEAKGADAEAVGAGKPAGAVKAARAALTDAQDHRDAAKSAQTMLADQRKALEQRLSVSESRLDRAVSAVVCAAPEVHSLLARYETARREYHALHGVLGILASARALPREFEVAVQNIDIREVIHRGLPPSEIAAQVQKWIEALRIDADAVLSI
jgi:hypothetical protein